MKEWPDVGGCAVWVQKADTPKPHHWRVWHTPIKDKRRVLRTAPKDWQDWGWYDDITTAPVKMHKTKSPKTKSLQEESTVGLILRLRGQAKAKAKD